MRLYYNGSDKPSVDDDVQSTRLALSADGLSFVATPDILGEPYMRVVRYADSYLALAMPGIFYRSRDGLTGFERGPTCFDDVMRHCALLIEGDILHVFYSQVGDMPERILRCEITLKGDWHQWHHSAPETVLEPERNYEGITAPLQPSVRGLAWEPVRELRDPAVFVDNGERYLLYSVAGERGIAIARLT